MDHSLNLDSSQLSDVHSHSESPSQSETRKNKLKLKTYLKGRIIKKINAIVIIK